jgi:hypothetical protein
MLRANDLVDRQSTIDELDSEHRPDEKEQE